MSGGRQIRRSRNFLIVQYLSPYAHLIYALGLAMPEPFHLYNFNLQYPTLTRPFPCLSSGLSQLLLLHLSLDSIRASGLLFFSFFQSAQLFFVFSILPVQLGFHHSSLQLLFYAPEHLSVNFLSLQSSKTSP